MNDVVQQVPQKQTSLLTLDKVSFPSFLVYGGEAETVQACTPDLHILYFSKRCEFIADIHRLWKSVLMFIYAIYILYAGLEKVSKLRFVCV